MYGHYPGVKILTSIPAKHYTRNVAQSVFCLAPAGWGFGGRFKTSMTRGCIPVIIQVSGGVWLQYVRTIQQRLRFVLEA